MFGLPSAICKQQLGTQINKANQNKTVDLYSDNVKTAADVPRGSFMHVHQAMVHAVGNDLQNGKIIYKTGIDVFTGAVTGNMETKKRHKDVKYSDKETVRMDEMHQGSLTMLMWRWCDVC
jgi:hypothetical protein